MSEAIVFEQLNAFWIFTKKGLEEALRVFPQYKAFIERNKNKTYKQLEKELRSKNVVKLNTTKAKANIEVAQNFLKNLRQQAGWGFLCYIIP